MRKYKSGHFQHIFYSIKPQNITGECNKFKQTKALPENNIGWKFLTLSDPTIEFPVTTGTSITVKCESEDYCNRGDSVITCHGGMFYEYETEPECVQNGKY